MVTKSRYKIDVTFLSSIGIVIRYTYMMQNYPHRFTID